jgi:hypothetical protein
VVDIDEIKKYLDGRYVFALEAAWRIFKFDMHERFPTVECLHYHLPNQQMVLFGDDDDVQEVATRSAISRTMLIEWFKRNQESEVARSFTFDQFPQQMGVESEVEVMDTVQTRLCHWLHVLCTPDIG